MGIALRLLPCGLGLGLGDADRLPALSDGLWSSFKGERKSKCQSVTAGRERYLRA